MEGIKFFLNELHSKDSHQGFAGLGLLGTSTLVSDFHLVVGVLMAIGGLALLIINILSSIQKYKILLKKENLKDDE